MIYLKFQDQLKLQVQQLISWVIASNNNIYLYHYSNSDLQYTDLIVKAGIEKDPLERMKLVTAFVLGGLHVNVAYCKSKPPLNPVLGETYQASKKDGCMMYMEQTQHHPPTSNFLMIGPNKSFEIYGTAETCAKVQGLNSLKGWKEGKSIIKFKDGTLMTWTCPIMYKIFINSYKDC